MKKIDIARLVGAVTREVSTREFNGAPARVLVASRTYDTSIEDLWDALTNTERIPRWFGPVSGDFRLGGRYEIEGNASGEITKCEPPRALTLTWVHQGDTSWVDVKLEAHSQAATELRLEHIAHVPGSFWDQYGPGAGGVGWELALKGLEQHFADTAAFLAHEEEEAWLATEEGKLFLSQSSDAWGEASIAAGTDATAARAAAQRTTKFYSGT